MTPTTDQPPAEMQPSIIPTKQRFKLVGVARLITAVFTLPGIFVFPMLPAGLFRIFGLHENAGKTSWLVAGWLAYIALTAAACMTRRRLAYFIIYSIICLLLALNTVGCRYIWSEVGGIH